MTAERLISVAQRLDELAEEHDPKAFIGIPGT